MSKFAALAAATFVLCSGSAFAEEQFCSGKGDAMPADQVIQKLETMGYQKVKKLDMEHGCYEAKGFDADGNRVEVYLEPATGEVVKIKKS